MIIRNVAYRVAKTIQKVHFLNNLSLALGQKTYRLIIRSPSSVQLHTLTECNLACDYCYADTSKLDDVIDFNDIIGQAYKLGVLHMDFLGGEPLLDPRLKEYLELCHKYKLTMTVHTNGLLVDGGWIEFLKRFGGAIKISIKFDVESELDKTIEAGHFQKVISKIKLLTSQGIKVQIYSFIHKCNFDRIGELIEIAKQENIFLTIERYMNQGRAEVDTKYAITLEQWNHALERYHSYCNGMQDGALYLNSLKGNGCACYIDLISIDARGFVKPCPFADESQAIGNVCYESLSNLWKKYRKVSKTVWMKIPKECVACKYRLYCHGGCKTAVFNHNKKYDVKDPLCNEGRIPMGIFQKP